MVFADEKSVAGYELSRDGQTLLCVGRSTRGRVFMADVNQMNQGGGGGGVDMK